MFRLATLISLAAAASRQADQVDTCESGIKVTHYNFNGHSVNPMPDWTAVDPFKTEVVDTVNIDSTYNNFYSSGQNSSLGAIFEGYVVVPESGEWTFGTNSDDGTMLYIGDQLLVNNDGGHGMRERTGAIQLDAGKHAYKVEYQQGGGPYGIKLMYGGPGTAYGIIPADRFVHNCQPKKTVAVSQWSDTMDFNDALQAILGNLSWAEFRVLIDDEEQLVQLATQVSD